MERVVFADDGPVDADSGINGGLDVFRFDVAASRPAKICRVRARRVGRADGAAALDSGAGKNGGLLQEVIAAAGGRYRADRPAKLADHDYQGLIEQTPGLEITQHPAPAALARLTPG